MDIILENEFLTVTAVKKGAEITSIKDNKDNTEYIWTGDALFWGRHAPILFPIVGRVKNNEYKIGDMTYKLNQHGFARDCSFDIVENNREKALFRLSFSEESLKVYPYRFELDVQYCLKDKTLEVTYIVRNVDSEDIYFSIGAHPGFNCPLTDGDIEQSSFEDYYFEFENKETAHIIPVSSNGFILRETEPFLNNCNIIPISHELFKKDALVFNNLKSKKISLKNSKSSKGITMDFTGFPYLGLWSKPIGAPFVCIEPWYGHTDFEDFEGDFKDKEDILKLNKGKEFCCKYSITALL